MRLRYSAQARAHIANLHGYIHDRSPVAAREVVARIRQAAERLCEFPRMGRAGSVAGTQEWVVRGLPYILVYQVGIPTSDDILVIGVYHAAQNRDPD